MISYGDAVVWLVLAGASAIAWRRTRKVVGMTWAWRIMPIGLIFALHNGLFSVFGLFLLGLTAVACAVVAYCGGLRLTRPKFRPLRAVCWFAYVSICIAAVSVICVPLARFVSAFGGVALFKVNPANNPMPWTRALIAEELPFAVDYKRMPTLCAEYDKRIRFKSGKTIGIWPDTGGGGPFAVYALADGTFYLVDGLRHDFIRSEYRVDAANETVERKGKHSWILVPDGSLGIVCGSDRDVMVRTADGEKLSRTTKPIGTSLNGRRFVGMVLVGGRFSAGGADPLAGVTSEDGEPKWNKVELPADVAFSLETRGNCDARKEFRVAFKSGKTFGLGGWLHAPFEIAAAGEGVYVLKYSGVTFTNKVRVDAARETLDVHFRKAWIRVPDGALEIYGVGSGGGRGGEPETYSVTVQTADGEATSTHFELADDAPTFPIGSVFPRPDGAVFKPTGGGGQLAPRKSSTR